MDTNPPVTPPTTDVVEKVNVVPPAAGPAPKLPSKLNWKALLPVLALALALPFMANSIRQRQLTGSRAAYPNSYPCSSSYPCPTTSSAVATVTPTRPCGNSYPCGVSPTPVQQGNQSPIITTTSLPSATRNVFYSATIMASDTDTTDTLAMTITGLPTGINSGSCVKGVGQPNRLGCDISGIASGSGTFNVNVLAKDGRGGLAQKTLSLQVLPGTFGTTPTTVPTRAPTATPTPVPNSAPRITTRHSLPIILVTGRAFRINIQGQDANRNDLLTMTATSLPAGVSFGPCVRASGSSNANTISCTVQGTPTRAGVFRSTVRLTDNRGASDQIIMTYAIVGRVPFITDVIPIPRLPAN